MQNLECQESEVWTKEKFHEVLKEIGTRRYHSNHPFHLRMHEGSLSKEEVRAWIINRFYYQVNLPVKDSIILSKLPSREDRRVWIQRILDHDGPPLKENNGTGATGGGIDAWVSLAEAAGISKDVLHDESSVHPSARFAVDAYVNFARNKSWYEAVASSLTELFAPNLISKRIEIFEEHYSWVKPEGLQYFKNRLSQAPRDCEHALGLVLTHGVTKERQEQAVKALNFKCDVLWSLLDATEKAAQI